jgi:NAD+ synthase (glutamine-hydrolysing)
MAPIRLAMVQTNPVVGAISANLDEIFAQVRLAAAEGAKLVVFGEMSATGYPIEDLAQRESFVRAAETAVLGLATRLSDAGLGHLYVLVGHPALAAQSNGWAIAQNSASLIHAGSVAGSYAKHHLPNYSVFDEYRVFVPGNESLTFQIEDTRFGVLICEDIWQSGGPVAKLREENVDVAVVLNGSPFELGKQSTREQLVSSLAKDLNAVAVYVNLFGGQDDLVFDGSSIASNPDGEVIARARPFAADRVHLDLEAGRINQVVGGHHPAATDLALVWRALEVGLRDYVDKNGFPSVILGLSGGIDSAVCAALAVDALGPNRVFGVSLPSRYSSDHSKSDAFDLATRLGIEIRTEGIGEIVQVAEDQLKLTGLSAENLQARVRGLILMALSNAEGHLTLTTGNKTELAVGYSTIYGDSVGGYAPIKDVAKTMVWDLARWRNSVAEEMGQIGPIPENSISKPPSAELRPDQLDQDSLPEYDLLDSLLEKYIDDRLGRAEIITAGFDPALVDRVIGLVDRAEWKRRQGAIGPKITGMAFGRDRRHPITNGYREI